MANIILLEPDSILAGSIKRYFANANHSVSVHSDPQASITNADKQRPDLVITELHLAGRSGIEFLYEFRSYPEWQTIPVIIYSSLHKEDVLDYTEVFNELNVQACLHKISAGLGQLLAAVEQSLLPVPA